MSEAAEDDAERARIRAELYAPPPGARKARGRPGARPPAMTVAESEALAARLEAEDARFSRSTAR